MSVAIDRGRTAARIASDIETLAGPDFTLSDEAIRRYAYTDAYGNTIEHFRAALEEIGFFSRLDCVGTLVARNRPKGEPVLGLGSHCDSNRNGGKYDGTLGVVVALEVCRLNAELDLGLALQLISFLEEEGSGFGQMLLGSRIVAQRVCEEDLRERFRSIDDGRSFWEHAVEAGFRPEGWRQAAHSLDDLSGWIECHIEQGRVLQDTGNRIGVVSAIAGYVHGDIAIQGRADHAGATPMDFRIDAAAIAAETVLELESLARAEKGRGTVGTVGEIEIQPNLINVVPGQARLSIDVRGVDESSYRNVARDIVAFARAAAERRGTTASFTERQSISPTPMAAHIVAALEGSARATGEPFTTMPSGAAHDTMCVADRVPSAMVFVPCLDGISHSPLEDASADDAALAAEIMLNAALALRTADEA
jgi:hydantoinase/carbamoylase family amidase